MTAAKHAVVAIDGPAGSGKSTVARAVAEALGLPTLDTGAMYRAVTWAVLDAGIDPADAPAVAALAQRVDLDVGPPVRVGGRDVNDAIRSAEVSAAVSLVAAVPEVRLLLVEAQRDWIETQGGGVVEGRDIGTVVAPDALLKIYLLASEEERARRRHRQDTQRPAATGDRPAPDQRLGGVTDRQGGPHPPEPETMGSRSADDDEAGGLVDTLDAIRRRDAIDSGRATSPLAVADDAVVLDSTDRSVEEVVEEILRRYRTALEAAERS